MELKWKDKIQQSSAILTLQDKSPAFMILANSAPAVTDKIFSIVFLFVSVALVYIPHKFQNGKECISSGWSCQG